MPLLNLPDFTHSASPDETAVIAGDASIRYGALEEQVSRLADHLHSLGVGPGVHVGVALACSIELIVSLLAIVKVGGAYIPLDPTYPQSRLDQMIISAGLQRILTTGLLAKRFPGIACVRVDEPLEVPALSTPQADTRGEDPLYAIFTSGSTGQPKAASVFRKGFANLLQWYSTELSLGPADRTLVISSPSFDLTQKNFFAPLATGGTLVLENSGIYDISRILRLIEDHRITLINCTPSAFYPLIDAAAVQGYEGLASLRHVVMGGEPISVSRLRAWLNHPACRAEVLNTYGPTECTDICAFHRLHRGNLDEFPFVPLGREIDQVEITIRDSDLNILPGGELGELCISGAGVGGGYLHDPARTRERFVNGFYRTGDLAKRLPCGTLEFRGRADHQVKVNGHRIELGEIEIALDQHDSVREAVVISRDNRLIAFVKTTVSLEAGVLRDHLSRRLPGYMVPGEFLFVEAFPLTPNGKIDRLALSTTLISSAPAKSSDSSLESRILDLWSEILGRRIDDPTANFFDLGGNSIHIAIVHVRLCRMIGREFPITDLFALPNARSIAEALSPRTGIQPASSAQDRARLQQAGLARFRRPPTR